ncbi:hypothetical protein G7K_4792-t1 [Saitoella complicata NRRL Y-17804]|uniref:Uncharacterized protein n=2 Tax=Saitoella complicata (strain BCRC 22490 / CBS 7301 / JCM 7358 / NBRC 10748 / NRRL Y-17804) TaxID=698492 RepID=A0A0E9NMM0_SAICN|nr:hypothetical protein G7K_4792-t1 [Saitoella complicata NRRL Y-17804]
MILSSELEKEVNDGRESRIYDADVIIDIHTLRTCNIVIGQFFPQGWIQSQLRSIRTVEGLFYVILGRDDCRTFDAEQATATCDRHRTAVTQPSSVEKHFGRQSTAAAAKCSSPSTKLHTLASITPSCRCQAYEFISTTTLPVSKAVPDLLCTDQISAAWLSNCTLLWGRGTLELSPSRRHADLAIGDGMTIAITLIYVLIASFPAGIHPLIRSRNDNPTTEVAIALTEEATKGAVVVVPSDLARRRMPSDGVRTGSKAKRLLVPSGTANLSLTRISWRIRPSPKLAPQGRRASENFYIYPPSACPTPSYQPLPLLLSLRSRAYNTGLLPSQILHIHNKMFSRFALALFAVVALVAVAQAAHNGTAVNGTALTNSTVASHNGTWAANGTVSPIGTASGAASLSTSAFAVALVALIASVASF